MQDYIDKESQQAFERFWFFGDQRWWQDALLLLIFLLQKLDSNDLTNKCLNLCILLQVEFFHVFRLGLFYNNFFMANLGCELLSLFLQL
jgi:hypothetical protein